LAGWTCLGHCFSFLSKRISKRPFGPIYHEAIQPVTPTIKDPKTAENKPFTEKSFKIVATIPNMAAFTTRRKMPRVATVMGSVRIIIRGRMIALTIPSSRAAIKSVSTPSMRTPGMRAEASQSPKALMTNRMTNPFISGASRPSRSQG
jgi:hypothetical protein